MHVQGLNPEDRSVSYRFDLLPPRALMAAAQVMAEGCRTHDPDGWMEQPVEEHLNRAMAHVTAHLMGNGADDHLPHALCRLLFAVEMQRLSAEVIAVVVKGGADEVA